MIRWMIVLLMTVLVSSLLYLIWYQFAKKFFVDELFCIYYYLLRLIILTFTIPVTFLWFVFVSFDGITWEGTFLQVTPFIRWGSMILTIIWVIGACVKGIKLIKDIRVSRQICRMHKRIFGWEEQIKEELCRELKIKRYIPIYRGEISLVSCLCGAFHPGIYIGEKRYTEEELKIILTHELTHYKHHDIWIYNLLNFLSIIYWFHPLFFKRKISYQYHCLCEEVCDDKVCKTENRSKYIKLLLTLTLQASNELQEMGCGFLHEESEVIRRVEKMENRKIHAKHKMVKGIACLVAMLLCSGTVTYAAGTGLYKGYDALYYATDTEAEEGYQEPDTQELIEYTEAADVDPGVIIEEVDDSVSARSTTVLMDWSVGANVQKQTLGFSKSAGSTIKILVDITPSNKTIQCGIIEPSGLKRYVSSSGMISHSFAINKSGTYKVFIRNKNTTSIHASGSYIK